MGTHPRDLLAHTDMANLHKDTANLMVVVTDQPLKDTASHPHLKQAMDNHRKGTVSPHKGMVSPPNHHNLTENRRVVLLLLHTAKCHHQPPPWTMDLQPVSWAAARGVEEGLTFHHHNSLLVAAVHLLAANMDSDPSHKERSGQMLSRGAVITIQ